MRDPRHLPIADPTKVGLAVDVAGDGCGCRAGGHSGQGDGGGCDDRALAGSMMPPDGGALGDERLLQVGDIAKLSGKTVRAIHHYEELGLLQPHARSKGRYRLYDAGAIARLGWIAKMHDLGLSLTQIQAIVRTWESAASAPSAMAEMRGIYQKKLEDTRAQIEHLRALERELQASIRYLDTCDTCDPAEIVQACASCHVHEKDQTQPELVAGIHGNAKRAAKAAAAAG